MNMPFSNEKGEGFENKLVDLIADKLQLQVHYTWLPQVVGHVATLPDDSECDILMGYAQGTGLIEDTNPYYRTSYVLIYRQDDKSLAGVESLADERLKSKTIGILARTPPVSNMAINGLMANAKAFETGRPHAGERGCRRDRGDRVRRDRRRHLVGAARRLLRAKRQGAARARSIGEGEGGTGDDLRHHHGRPPQRAGMEAQAEQADRSEPAGHQRHDERVQRAAARRERQSDQERRRSDSGARALPRSYILHLLSGSSMPSVSASISGWLACWKPRCGEIETGTLSVAMRIGWRNCPSQERYCCLMPLKGAS